MFLKSKIKLSKEYQTNMTLLSNNLKDKIIESGIELFYCKIQGKENLYKLILKYSE